jgi:NitT/TauT family transport system ATP-binding protein
VPTVYPKSTPSEVTGLLVLLKDHKGSEDVARLAGDLDLEIDEILPSLDFAEALQLLKVKDGHVTFTDIGRQFIAGSMRERKGILQEQLRKTTLFKALLRALESAPEHRLSEEEVNRLIEFTTAPADEFVQNIINWGRYAELFRYDSDAHVLLPVRARTSRSASAPARPPSGGATAGAGGSSGATRATRPAPPEGGNLTTGVLVPC